MALLEESRHQPASSLWSSLHFAGRETVASLATMLTLCPGVRVMYRRLIDF